MRQGHSHMSLTLRQAISAPSETDKLGFWLPGYILYIFRYIIYKIPLTLYEKRAKEARDRPPFSFFFLFLIQRENAKSE